MGSEADGQVIDYDSYVSMNFWGFPAKEGCAPAYLDMLEEDFRVFFETKVASDPLKAEHLIPVHVGKMLRGKECRVEMLETADKWFGVTYKEDKDTVAESFRQLIADGVYAEKLYSDL